MIFVVELRISRLAFHGTRASKANGFWTDEELVHGRVPLFLRFLSEPELPVHGTVLRLKFVVFRVRISRLPFHGPLASIVM